MEGYRSKNVFAQAHGYCRENAAAFEDFLRSDSTHFLTKRVWMLLFLQLIAAVSNAPLLGPSAFGYVLLSVVLTLIPSLLRLGKVPVEGFLHRFGRPYLVFVLVVLAVECSMIYASIEQSGRSPGGLPPIQVVLIGAIPLVGMFRSYWMVCLAGLSITAAMALSFFVLHRDFLDHAVHLYLAGTGVGLFFAIAILNYLKIQFFTRALNDMLVASLQKQMVEDRREYERVVHKNIHLEAVATTTQMLAHDVRKPFSLLKIGIERLIATEQDAASMRTMAMRINDHVSASLQQINGMLADVMEVSSKKSALQKEQITLGSIIENALSQSFRFDTSCHIGFDYVLHHVSQLSVDPLKVQRVFCNILENARQAMNAKGRIWIRSYERIGDPFLEITVGNSHSFIPADIIPSLFEAFFTSGKKGGTGLGLAIVQKIVLDHGGTIRCQSHIDTGTEFIFTLPVSLGTKDIADASLPKSSAEVRAKFEESLSLQGRREFNDGKVAPAAAADLPEILLVDDDIFVIEYWEATCKDAVIVSHTKPETVLAALRKDPGYLKKFVAVITDFYFGEKSNMDGAQFAQAIRQHFKGVLILSSDSFDWDEGESGLFDHRIDKLPVAWGELQSNIAAASSLEERRVRSVVGD